MTANEMILWINGIAFVLMIGGAWFFWWLTNRWR